MNPPRERENRFSRCPKCGYRPLPMDQSLPAACPACSVILAKVGRARPAARPAKVRDEPGRIAALLLQVPERVDAWR